MMPKDEDETENDKSTTANTTSRPTAKSQQKKKEKKKKKRKSAGSKPPDYEFHFDIVPNQALLYRLASGDSNKIHVVGDETMFKILGLSSSSPPQQQPKETEQQEEKGGGGGDDDDGNRNAKGSATKIPILHGLCTFGVAARAILRYVGTTGNGNKGDDGDDAVPCCSFEKLEGRFTKPVFLNDSLTVRLWEETTTTTSTYDDDAVAEVADTDRRHHHQQEQEQDQASSSSLSSSRPPRRRRRRRTISFVVVNKQGETVLDQGFVQLRTNNNNKDSNQTNDINQSTTKPGILVSKL